MHAGLQGTSMLWLSGVKAYNGLHNLSMYVETRLCEDAKHPTRHKQLCVRVCIYLSLVHTNVVSKVVNF